MYSGTNTEIFEDDIPKIFIPLNDRYSFDAKMTENKIHLSRNQERILEEIRKDSSVTAKVLSEKIGISERKIQDNMRYLKEQSLISRIGGNKSGKWIVNPS